MDTEVGIVVRTKDRPDLLVRALTDIQRQRYTAWHVVVVNDGGDRRAVDAACAASPVASTKLTVIDTVGATGRCAAANQGIRSLDAAELVVLHDDDDLWDPAFLETTVAWLDAHPEDSAVVVPTEIVVETWDGDAWRAVDRERFWAGMSRISLGEMLRVNRAVPISVVYRRRLHDEVGWYDESLDTVEDWDFYLRILVDGAIGFIDGPVLAYWTHRPSAQGASANSMFDLAGQHLRDDQIVRDRALQDWVRVNGIGLPMYIAGVERRLAEEMERGFAAVLRESTRHAESLHPVWSRVKRVRQRLRRGQS